MMLGRGFEDTGAALAYLDDIGATPDADIDIFEGALALCAPEHPGVIFDKYRNHRVRMADDLRAIHSAKNTDDLESRIESLAEVFTRKHGYIGDDLRYNDLQNADLIRVIDRRLGMPITLSILCLTLARDMGWDAQGINFPGHFIMRLSMGPQRAIIDPFQGCLVLQAPDLRAILKRSLGQGAELSADYYQVATNRETLIRLQNNIKLRLIEAEDYESALYSINLMKRLAPDEYRLDLDAGVILARLNQPLAAIESLERYIARTPDARDRADASLLLSELRSHLH